MVTKTVTVIEAVIQRNPSGTNWYAGYGCIGLEGDNAFSGGSYLQETHDTRKAAKAAALEIAASYRNQVLTMGGCTFETLPPIKFKIVG